MTMNKDAFIVLYLFPKTVMGELISEHIYVWESTYEHIASSLTLDYKREESILPIICHHLIQND